MFWFAFDVKANCKCFRNMKHYQNICYYCSQSFGILWTMLLYSTNCSKAIEAVVWRSSLKRCSLKFRKIHRKTPVPESLFNKVAGSACNFIKNETLAQVFSCEFCEISNNVFFLQNTSGGCFSQNWRWFSEAGVHSCFSK